AAVSGHMLVRYCPGTSTAWTLRSIAADGTAVDLSHAADGASFGDAHVVWLETGGVLAASADAVTSPTLASNAAGATPTHDASHVGYLSTTGAIFGGSSDGPLGMVVPSGAVQLGGLSPDGAHVLYATQAVTKTHDDVAPYTDVRVASSGSDVSLV